MITSINEYKSHLNENLEIDKLLNFELDNVKISLNGSHAILSVEQLKDGEPSIYISEIWSDIKGKGNATKLLNKLKDYSDKTSVPLSLRASIQNNINSEPGLSQSELIDWYIKNGFEISEDNNNFPTDKSAPFMLYNY